MASGSLSGDGTSDESVTLTAPSAAGIYYYGACVDSVPSESWTENNCSRAIPVAVRTSLNQAPKPVNTIPAQTLTVGGSAASVDVSSYFDDPDNDSLTYTVTSDNTEVATASVSGATVTITPESAGSTTVTVIASDGTLTATQHIAVTVKAAPRTVQTLEKISGDNQQGEPNTTLTNPFIVEVRDANGNPFEGILVTFTIIAGGGSLKPQTATTDANGQASTTLTLGPNAETNTVEVSVTGISASARFTATAQEAPNQAPEPVGSVSAQTLSVGGSAARVNVSSNFRDPDNDSLTYTATSDNTGTATVSVSGAVVTIAPKSVGSATVTVTASDGTLTAMQRIAVTVEAAPRVAHTLEKISGDNQQDVPGATLTSPFVVEVRDAAGNPLGGIIVTFAVTAGGGTLSRQTATTNASGQASTTLTLGPNAGTNTVEASVSVIATSLRFTAIAEARVGEARDIPDPNLRAAIEKALGKASGETITATEMATLTGFTARNVNIRDLTGLERATNLVVLGLDGKHVNDIWVNSNSISDISPLSGLTGLEWLWLGGNSISDISPLAGLTNLTWLTLEFNNISDISPLSDLTKLTELVIFRNNIPDISPLSDLTKLTKLRLEQNRISSISPLSGLTDLTELILRDNNITDLSPLVANTGLGTGDRVDVRGNPLNSLSVHTHIPALQSRGVTVNFEMDVNRAPESVGTIPAQTLTVGGSTARVNVSSNFHDPDNDNLTYTATSDNTRVATISVSGAVVTITPEDVGSATVTVTASDGTLTARQDIEVTIEAAPRVAHALVKISGDNQQGAPGEALLSPIVVEVRDTENRGLEGVDVTFTVTAGGGSLSERTVTTGANGQASSRLTLGDNEGDNTVRVSAEGVSQTVIFNAVGANEINIPDRYLRAEIERALSKRAGDPITAAEMATLTRLDARNSRISDLTGLKFATNLTWLNLYNNSLTTLPTDAFKGLSKVTNLYLEANLLKTIKTGAFNGLNSLTELSLRYMSIETVESGAFNGLSNLQSLNLYDNKLATLSTDTFKRLSQVTSLDLRGNPLITIKTGAFNGLSSLTKLDLRYATGYRGHLKTIEPGAFKGLNNLRTLNLYGNRLTTLSTDTFEGLSQVTSLDLRGNPLTTIEAGAFNELANLTELNLSGMTVQTIEGGAFNGLNNLRTLNLYDNKLATLSTDTFKGLSQVTSLDLRGNPLVTIKTGAFNGLSSLTKLDLRYATGYRGHLKTIEPGAFKGLNNLRTLNLYNNRLTTLSTGTFEGLSSLQTLDLRGNPGAPFTLVVELVRTDTTDLAAPGPATVVVYLAQGAPFEMTVDLSAEGGTLSATRATITRGEVQSDPITLTQSGTRPATVHLEAAPRVPSGYSGIRMAVGDPLSTGSIPPHSMVKISGDNQQGHAGETLENPLIVEVRDAGNRGLGDIDVTFAVTAGDGTLSERTVTTDANGQAESWLTLGSQMGTNTVQASVEGLSAPVIFNAIVESMQFTFSVSAGVNLIHVPLQVTSVDGVEQPIESIADLYDALGGAARVNFLITHDSDTQAWLSYFGASDRGTAGDRVLKADMGIIAGMFAPVSILLSGNPLATSGNSTITLNPGINIVGLPLRDERIKRVSDLLKLAGIEGNVPVIMVSVDGEYQVVGRAGDPGDIGIVGGQAFILTAQQAATVMLFGDGWTNISGAATAPSVSMTGIVAGDVTPVLGLRGSIVDETMGNKMESFRVIVKNLSTGRAVASMTGPDAGGYRLTVVDIETGRAAAIGDTLEISAQSPNPFIGVKPVQYTVTAEDVRRSLIQLPELVAYEIPAETQLLANYPNPFNPETWIPYRLAKDAFVTLTIYDQTGQVVRTIDVGHQPAAVYERRSKAIYWDRRNEFGEQVASGVYFYHLQAGDYSATRRMVIVK